MYSRFFLNKGEGGSHLKYFKMKILLTLNTLCGGFLSLLTYSMFGLLFQVLLSVPACGVRKYSSVLIRACGSYDQVLWYQP